MAVLDGVSSVELRGFDPVRNLRKQALNCQFVFIHVVMLIRLFCGYASACYVT